MKKKVLLTGNHKAVINEFFTYMDFVFECMTTSNRYDDIMNHIKYVEPDVFVYCLSGERLDDLKRFANVEIKLSEKGIPVVVIGEKADCDQLSRVAPMMKVTVLQKPIMAQQVQEQIQKLLEQTERKKQKAEKQEKKQQKEPSVKTASSDVDDILSETQNLLSEIMNEEKKAEENRRKHILVVDDDSGVLKLIKGYLAPRYDIATAISGKVAMKFLENKKTDLVLLDYEMPQENGPEILRQIRENKNLKNLPVVFLTGVTEREKIQEVLAMKPQGYLLKPIDMERLSSTIKGILE